MFKVLRFLGSLLLALLTLGGSSKAQSLGEYWAGQGRAAIIAPTRHNSTSVARPIDIRPHIQIATTDLLRAAMRFNGHGNPTKFRGSWCGEFLGMVARSVGKRPPANYRMAMAWLNAGRRVAGPSPGDYVVSRHHVGVMIAMTPRGPRIVSGNWGHRVGIGVVARGSVIAYVRPS